MVLSIAMYHWPVGRVFANGPGDMGSIPVCVISKTLKMVLDTSLLNTQQYKVCIEGRVEQSRERSSSLSYTSVSSPSSCPAASTDIPDPLSPLLPIIHRLWLVFSATSHILT